MSINESNIELNQKPLTAKSARAMSNIKSQNIDAVLKKEIDKEILEACEKGWYEIEYFSELKEGINGFERNIENIYKPLGFKVSFDWHGLLPGTRKKYCIISW